MIIIGLTGSVGMGKSTCAAIYRRLGAPVHDADAVVHALMRPKGVGGGGECFDAVADAFPDAFRDGVIDRRLLGAAVFKDPRARRRLEAILHPAVRRAEISFLHIRARQRARAVVLDIPLLFETGADLRCDLIAVVSAPERLQRRRVMNRPGMTAEKFAGILSAQLPDSEKRACADIIIPSGRGKTLTRRAVRASLGAAAEIKNGVWPVRYMRDAAGREADGETFSDA
ncbi:MAG: dephospho-CoA kinase [Rhodospirillales bacterium]